MTFTATTRPVFSSEIRESLLNVVDSPNTPQSKDRAPKISDGSAFATNVHHHSF
jgi:hypothetical protein